MAAATRRLGAVVVLALCLAAARAVPAVPAPKLGPVFCGNGTAVCPSKTTCCLGARDGEWACCQFEQGECCADRLHCCPQNTLCEANNMCHDNSTGQVFGAMPKLPAFIAVIPATEVKETAASPQNAEQQQYDELQRGEEASLKGQAGCPYCNDDQTCCQQPSGDYKCCPYANANCCPQTYCCPSSYTCDKGNCYPSLAALFDGLTVPQPPKKEQ